MHKWLNHCAAALMVVGAAGIARAQSSGAGGVRFDAHVAQENITLDQAVELTVTLDREGGQVFEGYRAPAAPDFDILHSGTTDQMQFSMIHGRQSVHMVEQHNYLLKPKKKGALTIGPAAVRVAGTQLSTRPITIHVAPVPKNAMSTVTPSGQTNAQPQLAPAPDTLRGDEDLFVDARADKEKVYVGEQLTATWRLYTQSEILKYRPLAEPKHEDFWCEDLFVPTGHLAWDRQIVKGHEYAVAVLLKKALFPLKAGKLTITPLEAESTTMQSAFYANASAARRSAPIVVEVLPLPVAGRPPGFDAANVGQLSMTASVDRASVKAGEAVTLKLVVKGVGNLRNVKVAKLDLPGFKAYEPATRENIERADVIRGEKTFTYLLMPLKGGALTLPAIELPYFDPAAAKYEVARTQPIAITVEGDPSKVQAQSPSAAPEENVLAQQIRPIRNRSSVRSRIGERLFRGRLALALLATPPASWLLVLIIDALRRRLMRETARSKRRRARRTARRRLRVAEYHIKAQRPSAFFGECARVIYEHLEYRLGSKVEALTLAELRAHLEARAFSKETADAVVRELENCDFARFAPSASGPGEMRAALRRVRTLLGWIEKVKPSESGKEVAA
ncbi:MAG TPA: BatD family protein [Polyangia bacterium]|nr:BatD family protein [Polyangia bacterium]